MDGKNRQPNIAMTAKTSVKSDTFTKPVIIAQKENDEYNRLICGICYDEIKTPSLSSLSSPSSSLPTRITLTKCGHEFCHECLARWFSHIEKNSNLHNYQALMTSPPSSTTTTGLVAPVLLPTCPHCRETIQPENVIEVLGRPMTIYAVLAGNETNQQSSTSHNSLRGNVGVGDHDGDFIGILTATNLPYEDDADGVDFTMTYLQENNARQCPGCKLWIIRDGGCENVMCRCGCRFCFCCGEKNNCTGLPFYNNSARGEEYDVFMYNVSRRTWEIEEVDDLTIEEEYLIPLFVGHHYWYEIIEPFTDEEVDVVPLFGGSFWYQVWVSNDRDIDCHLLNSCE